MRTASLHLDKGSVFRGDPVMNTGPKVILVAVVSAFCTSLAWAGPVLTFEGLRNFEQIASFYDGGEGSLGSGPGPDYGVRFSSLALAYIPGLQTGKVTPFPGDPSPPTVMLLFDPGNRFGAGYPTSLTMDVSRGFIHSLTFSDIAIGRIGSITIYSETGGGGSILAQQTLPITPEAFSSPITLSFSGTAESVVFKGGNDQLAVDNITFSAIVPEPTAWISLMVGLGSAYLLFSRRRRKPAAH